MAINPQVRYRRDRKSYYTRLKGRQYPLGRDYDAAISQFQKLTRQLGVNPNAGPTPRTIASLVERWQQIHVSQFQLEMTVPFVEHTGLMALEHIPLDILDKYNRTLIDRGLAAESIAKYVRYARKVLRWGFDHGFVSRVPPRPADVPIPVRMPKDASREAIEKAFGLLRMNPRRQAYYIFTFIAETGCRPGEARLLEWEDVRLNEKFCILPKHKTSHRGKARIIVMNTRARAVIRLLRWKACRKGGPGLVGHVFLSRLRTPYTKNGLYIILKRLELFPYQLRHTWAQTSTLPDSVIAAALGHSDLRTIQTYRHVKPAALVASVAPSSSLTRLRAPSKAPPPEAGSIPAY